MAKPNWAWARRRWETTNATLADVAREIGVTRAAVCTRARKENWTRIVVSEAGIQQRADHLPEPDAAPVSESTQGEARLSIAQPSGNLREQEAEAIDLRARLIQAHRREWREHAREFSVAKMAGGGLAVARLAKTSAEALLARQRGERLAWGLDDPQMRPQEIVIEWMEEPRPGYDYAHPLSTQHSESCLVVRRDLES